MNPRAIRKLFAGRLAHRGHADLRPGARARPSTSSRRARALRIPPPPTMMNHGNWVVSRLRARALPRRAGRGGRRDDPARDRRADAARRPRPRRRRAHGRQGARQGRRAARELRAGRRRRREGHRPRRGHRGPPHQRGDRPLRPPRAEPADLGARREGGLEGAEAAAAGSSTRWAGRCARARATASSAARGSTRWATTTSRSGFVVGLEYADVELSAHDLLQEFKTHRLVRKILDGGERVAWGAKTITEGGLHSCRRSSTRPGCCSSARAPGSSTCRGSRASTTRSSRGGSRPRRRSRRCSAARSRDAAGRARPLRRGAPRELRLEGPRRGQEHAPGLRQGLLRRRRARERDDGDEGEAAAEGLRDAPERGRRRSCAPGARRATRRRTAS